MQIKVGSKLYPFPTRPLELGEQRRLKREYGVVPGRDEFDLQDPDHLAAFLYAAMREADRDAPASALIARIDRVRTIEVVGDDGQPVTDTDDDDDSDSDSDAPGPDPTPAAAGAASASS